MVDFLVQKKNYFVNKVDNIDPMNDNTYAILLPLGYSKSFEHQ